MDIPKAIFVHNKDTEVQRLIHTAKQVWSGFYVKKGYKVLPYLLNGDPNSIYFPESGFIKIPNIDRILRRTKLDFPIKYNQTLASSIEFRYRNINLDEYSKQWSNAESEFWKIARTLFPDEVRIIKSLEIRVTRFGSISSFQFLDKKGSGKIIIYLRKDADIAHIAEAILISLTTIANKYENSWEKNKQFSESILKTTGLRKLFPNYKTTKLKKNNSQTYIRELGVKIPIGLTVLGRKMYFNNRDVTSELSRNQFTILTYMLKQERFFIDHAKISEIIWGNNQEKYSLWAINKTMQRLRAKLISLGASKDCLTTSRKRGYFLSN